MPKSSYRRPALRDSDLNQRVAHLLDHDKAGRSKAAADIVANAYESKVLRSWSEMFSKSAKDIPLEDIEQIVAEAMMRKLMMVTADDVLRIDRWSGKLFLVCRQRVRQEESNPTYAEFSGMAMVKRRRALIANARDVLWGQLHREPTNAEITAAIRSMPGREGVGITDDDFNTSRRVVSEWVQSGEGEVSIIGYIPSDEPSPEEVVAEDEGSRIAIEAFLDIIGDDDLDVAIFARAWAIAAQEDSQDPWEAGKRALEEAYFEVESLSIAAAVDLGRPSGLFPAEEAWFAGELAGARAEKLPDPHTAARRRLAVRMSESRFKGVRRRFTARRDSSRDAYLHALSAMN